MLFGVSSSPLTSASAAPLRCGVAGWEHPSWDSQVYPNPRPRNFHPLRYLAARVDSLEIESTFRRTPRPETTALWAAHVVANPNFRFAVKLHRDFTHERQLDAAHVEACHEAMRPLSRAKRVGCVVMQMPASFRFTAENRSYLIQLRRTFHEFPLVAELRHRSWAADEALGTLVDYHIGFANIDQPETVCAMPPSSRLTNGLGYFKLHGRGAMPGHFEFDDAGKPAAQPFLYTLADLEGWAQRINYVRRFANEVFVTFANNASACSLTNVLQMERLLETPQPQTRKATHQRPDFAATPLLPFRAA